MLPLFTLVLAIATAASAPSTRAPVTSFDHEFWVSGDIYVMASRNGIDMTYGWAQWAMAQQLYNIGGNEPINASLIWICKHLKNPLDMFPFREYNRLTLILTCQNGKGDPNVSVSIYRNASLRRCFHSSFSEMSRSYRPNLRQCE